ncbi:hypothetical protein MSG28_012343 [Choristoneura fumiferana]|uniref:Uncharacterized protein n=1 Tax=Choristoneura fumiferana TaxID=7141 RepID=A0ACC0KCJ0_CHOFU|nr:hypothetical protein MSG28_012343 [Choristoneura fumiferana]
MVVVTYVKWTTTLSAAFNFRFINYFVKCCCNDDQKRGNTRRRDIESNDGDFYDTGMYYDQSGWPDNIDTGGWEGENDTGGWDGGDDTGGRDNEGDAGGWDGGGCDTGGWDGGGDTGCDSAAVIWEAVIVEVEIMIKYLFIVINAHRSFYIEVLRRHAGHNNGEDARTKRNTRHQ